LKGMTCTLSGGLNIVQVCTLSFTWCVSAFNIDLQIYVLPLKCIDMLFIKYRYAHNIQFTNSVYFSLSRFSPHYLLLLSTFLVQH
jgi:hypothetical protein